MGNRWFVTRDGKKRYGPFSDAQLRQLASAGKLLPSDMLLLEGSSQWVAASSIDWLFSQNPAAKKLPKFYYVHLPLLSANHRCVQFLIDRSGTVTGVSKTVRTYVSGGGGGGSVYTDPFGRVQGSSSPVWIFTTHKTTIDLWILEPDGRESSVRIEEDIPLKEGHRVTVVSACLDGRYTYHCLILNHTAAEMYFLKSSLSVIRLSLLERSCILAAPIILICVFVLLAVLLEVLLAAVNRHSDRMAGLVCIGWFIALVGGIIFIIVRRILLRRRFARHCEHVARLLL